jgi:hypothetical protein
MRQNFLHQPRRWKVEAQGLRQKRPKIGQHGLRADLRQPALELLKFGFRHCVVFGRERHGRETEYNEDQPDLALQGMIPAERLRELSRPSSTAKDVARLIQIPLTWINPQFSQDASYQFISSQLSLCAATNNGLPSAIEMTTVTDRRSFETARRLVLQSC